MSDFKKFDTHDMTVEGIQMPYIIFSRKQY